MIKRYIALLLLTFFFIGCKKKADPILNPTKTTLILPAQGEVCVNSTVISEAKSAVNFNWSASKNTDSYEISVKNLLTGSVLSKITPATSILIELDRNTPFSWSIRSKSNSSSVVEESDSWKFYNPGPGVQYYAPFPAEIIAPIMGQNINTTDAKVKLEWKGSDVDNDIKSYNVYFGTSVPVLIKEDVQDNFLAEVSVLPNTQYFWKVITTDKRGNTSDSGIYRFKTN